MEILHSLILGVVQGLTELLPVSSSAHLNLFPWVFGWSDISESFDVALHIGTLLAIIIFFYKDWVQLIKGGYNQVVKKKKSTEGKIFWYIVIATIPTGIACLVLDKLSGKLIEILAGVFKTSQINTQMFIIAIALIVMGIILYVVDKNSKSKTKYKDITFKQSLLISLSQAIAAAFPGVSRSGITMTALYELKHFVFDLSFVIGVLASFIVGMFVIKFLLNYLKKGSFKVFAIYRVALGIIVLIILMTRL